MIDILKKRYKVGDTVTLHTSETSFTGIIDAFEDTCVILVTEEGEEFIANDTIKRISVPKSLNTEKTAIIDVIEPLQDVVKPIIENKPAETPQKSLNTEKTAIIDVIEPLQEVVKPIIENKPAETPQKSLNTEKTTIIDVIEPLQEVIKLIIENKPAETPQVKEALPKTEYKVGDKIPLEELERLTDKRNKPKFPKTKGKGITLGSLSDLKQLILPEIEAENKKIVSANGTIIRYKTETQFSPSAHGDIIDSKGNKIWFSPAGVIEDDLLKLLNKTTISLNIPVLFSLVQGKQDQKAVNIHKPKTVEQVAELAKNIFEKEGKADIALGLIEQILSSYPENYTAKKLKEDINQKSRKQFAYSPAYKAYDLNYQRAKKLHNTDKNYEAALKYYFLAFKNNEKRESCIKDIAMLYVSMGEPDKAIEFIKKYERELPKNITTYNYLENFYGSAKDFEKVLEYTDLLLEEKLILNDRRKNAMYLSRKGFALIQLNKLDDAREILEEAVSIQPENTYAQRLLQALDEPDNEELNQIIADAEFDSFGGGLSKFIKDTLEKYDEYFGVPAKVIDSGDFSKETLNAIRRLIDTAGRARPRERANYLLTESKLMTSLEPDKENNLRSVLARYCNAMALNHISENSSTDVIRYYYLEAFSLEENYRFTAPQVAIYLFSFKSSYTDLFSVSTKTPSIEDAINFVLEGDYRENIWEGILSMFLWNRSISAQVTSKLFENKQLKEKSITFLSSLGLLVNVNTSTEDYTNLWNQAREKRQRDYSRLFASLKAISNNENLETLTNLLLDSLTEAKKNWLTQLDTSRLNILASDIYDVLATYLRQSGYRDKERSYNYAKAQINQLITEIKEKPTKFSYEGFIPLLEKIELLLEKSFKTVESASTPKVKASILGEASLVGNDNIIPFQITVENSKDSSPIRDIKIEIENSKDIEFISNNNIYYDSIDGGEYTIFKLSVQISDKIIKDKAATLDVICQYKTRNQEEPVSIKEQLSLRLYSEDEFETIENPYAPIADGGPVTDKRMFYGRDEFINNRITAILNADSKQIIIYGQKRSGKSSVLHHLKQGLEATNKTFCVSFSLGEIIRDLNEYTFYHKIIYGISRALRLRKINGEIVPEFICPTEAEFKAKHPSNPANGFIDLIEDFKMACSGIKEWENKKLVIMIDEFTYLYTAIRSGSTSDTIMKQWKAITQNENSKFSVVLVGQDVVPSFKKEDYAKNAFGVIEDIRLTYLDLEDAKKLIEEPIWNKNESRFIGRAVDTIIDYTSRNPYYIQIFCARLVDYMNAKKLIRVTEADIKEVAETFIEGSQALAPEKFDNLIRAGEEHDFIEFDDEPIIKILRQIAIGSKNIGICSRDNISLKNKNLEDKIISHLVDREVLEHKQGDNYKIQVKLFQEWLLRH
jgi:tetratricopeptide (TPR) repeat protein